MSVASRWTIPADHPRIRGEHVRRPLRQGERLGSSPHTRGAPTSCRSWHSPLRIIPAYAGSTLAWSTIRATPPDHPRIRGEHGASEDAQHGGKGSSPHTRGALAGRELQLGGHRIIPAYAGSTIPHGQKSVSAADHPRIRGEHERVSDVSGARAGSSPHTRGALSERGDIGVGRGIIPAYAGSTSEAPCTSPAPGDHPRIRGEHLPQTSCIADKQGSSPHTRGALGEDNARDYPGWIIPAYAGSTRMPGTCPKPRGDHPRIRGEHGVEEELDIVVQGSSPHTRGARGAPPDVAAVLRIIPAYAGSTGPAGTPPSETPDHPRIRGEHPSECDEGHIVTGSSPHTRGAPDG